MSAVRPLLPGLGIPLLCAVLLLPALAGCDSPEQQAARKREAASVAQASENFSRDEQLWREQRRAELTRPDGWTSLIGLHPIDPGSHYFGSDPDNGIRLLLGPEHIGLLSLDKGRLRFVPESGVALTLNDQPLKGAVSLLADDYPAGPSKIGFDEGKGLLTVIERGDKYYLRVRHADAPARTGFKGIDYWPAQEDWKVTAKFIAHPAGKTLDVANIIGNIEATPNPGAIEFERDGQTYRIEALDEGDDELMLVFADRTSGHTSYSAGRFLDVPRPNLQGKVTVDFNKAYNPPCAFTAFATCPLPPEGNRLNLEITAGEKTYKSDAGAAPAAPHAS
ncbi:MULTISPECIES: DUF1684 domain-containing protein [unclassified Lysobacter]|uniref:DUF1684 domain-containing protein n=1 Tax=unclassified Lysobacter TaxID=2635362 RepID=UPI001BEADCEC|nr:MULTISPECIES: DUF1684 domain-containing protein [unclassified Lysobacter]MBT2749177.1 DUF1684 domain-containing protein [Lysobacter sp. ISL-42]MBT2753929.1 DUF1684 domain-containing protein [Lysobacter sp. ISL-50]MBT2779593.1 DUF1684 domain-containing protein [Lysobacter sp. ISL-54]MBT2784517.1 DUF1684 domain-containing protein [Lysobacter sp. ISL-52]